MLGEDGGALPGLPVSPVDREGGKGTQRGLQGHCAAVGGGGRWPPSGTGFMPMQGHTERGGSMEPQMMTSSRIY